MYNTRWNYNCSLESFYDFTDNTLFIALNPLNPSKQNFMYYDLNDLKREISKF